MDDRPDPVEESSDHPTPAPAGHRRPAWRLAVLAAVLAALLATLVVVAEPNEAVARYRLQISAHPNPAQLDYVIGSVPAEFAPVSAVGADTPAAQYIDSKDAMFSPYELFGTKDDPTRPTLWISTDNRWEDYPSWEVYTDVGKFWMNGRSGLCAQFVAAYDLGVGPRSTMCWLDRSSDAVSVRATGLDADAVKSVLGRIVTVNGELHLPPDAAPVGITLLEKATRTSLPQYPVSSVTYRGPCGTELDLTVGWADEVNLASVQLQSREWTRVPIGSSTGFLTVGTVNAQGTLAWIADGKAFTLRVVGYADLPALARSVRRATPSEWSTAGQPKFAPTMPPVDAAAAVVEESVVQVPSIVSTDAATLVARGRLGDSEPLTVRRSGPQVHIVAPDGSQVWKCAPPSVTTIELTGASVVDGVEHSRGVVALATDLGPWQMEVQAVDGTRYVTRFARLLGDQPHSNPPPVYVAYVALPTGIVAGVVVKDALGKVIATK